MGIPETPYIECVANTNGLSLTKCIDIAKQHLTSEQLESPWQFINHGVSLLQEEDQLNCYLAAYGEMHDLKCRVAFQNFPFDDLISGFEVVDWGCGQGIATMCFHEFLKDHEKANLLKRVTLIEPSKEALDRACWNVVKATGCTDIVPINRYLPGNSLQPDNQVLGIDYKYTNIVHLFSNILDISSIDLNKLATILNTSGKKHYIVCICPNNHGSFRIDEFAEIFKDKKDFINVTNNNIGYTPSTAHRVTCHCRGFVSENSPLLQLNSLPFLEEDTYCDENDPMFLVRSGDIPECVEKVRHLISLSTLKGDYLFVRPDIYGDRPDLVLIRPNVGILIVKVFDKDLKNYKKDTITDYKDGKTLTKVILKNISNEKDNCDMPTNTIDHFVLNLAKEHIKDGDLGKTGVFRRLLVCTKNDTQTARDFFDGAEKKKIVVVGDDTLDEQTDLLNISRMKSNRYNHSIIAQVNEEVLNIIVGSWHYYRGGDSSMSLTKEQMKLAKSEKDGKQKISGIAGSGKTQVLAARAVNAHLRTGKDVLILTYNITLRNYIRKRLDQVKATYNKKAFYITNYHQFFKSEANNYGIHDLHLGDWEDENYFKRVRKQIKKYSAILIDEVQDYRTNWLNLLQNYFLEEGGEFVVFGDIKQDIYKQASYETEENTKTISIPQVPGRWNGSLNRSYRFVNPNFEFIAANFKKEFMDDDTPVQLALQSREGFSFYNMSGQTAEQMYENLEKIIREKNERALDQEEKLTIGSTAMIAAEYTLLRKIDYIYRNKTGRNTTKTFETIEEYSALQNRPDNSRLQLEIDGIQRNRKLHFTMDGDNLKMSSIHSFKGWEADTIILFLQKDRVGNEELIYTAITRARKNLIVVGITENKYNAFFDRMQVR